MSEAAATQTQPDALSQALNTIKLLEEEVNLLREQVRFFKARLFGRGTEKSAELPSGQQSLFDLDDETADLEEEEDEDQENASPPKRKKRGKRRPIPDCFPRRDIVHDVSEEEKICGCGCQRVRIGEEVSEQIGYIPAQVEIHRHVRPTYACPACEGMEATDAAVVIAPPPAKILPKCLAGPSLLAEIMTNKFADGIPFYRQEKRFARLGLGLDRTTMSNWAMKLAKKSHVLVNLLHRDLLGHHWLQIDETTLQVMQEDGRANRKKSFMWVIRGGPPDRPAILFRYHPTRKADVAKNLLKDYQGYVQTDGYKGYDFLGSRPGIIHMGCWAHVRRKFADVIKSNGKRKSKKTHAEVALNYIGELYRLERKAKKDKVTGQDLLALRQDKGKAIATEFRKWIDGIVSKVPPDSLLGKAIHYTLAMWPRLIVYLETDFAPPDNNWVENAIRPFVLGRKNWMFAGCPEGASASAGMFSLIETAKANGWEPSAYFYFLFTHLPTAITEDELCALLPTVAKPIPLHSLLDNNQETGE